MTSKLKVSFGRIFWPSLLASTIVLVLLFVFIFGLIGSLSKGADTFKVEENTILHMKLSGSIGESTATSFDPTVFGVSSKVGLSDILFGLEKAAEDPKVKGLFLELDMPNCGIATSTEIRNAINEFEESGKFVVAYFQGEVIGMKQYYIGSAANERYGFPSSVFEFMGMGAELMFYKGMLDKLDVEIQIVRGSNNDFKSAVEPYFLSKISDSSRVQLERYLHSMWEDVRSSISEETGVSAERLNTIADSTYIRRVTDAVREKLLTDALYRDEVMALLVNKVDAKDVDDLNLMSFEKYAKKKFENDQLILESKSPNIAVIRAEGGIGKSGDGISSDKLVKIIREVREDEDIKVVVFRVNSPGGSALASDEIWREIILTKAEKPIIVSMGDVAASGGYYIAAPANRIFAESTTITGSIGVFGMIPYTGKMFENKLGITFDEVKTNHRAVVSTNKKMSDGEFQIVQDEVDLIYDQFLGRVAEGRNMTKEQVNQVARGRVWTGKDAVKIGLVDELGGVNDAIQYAADFVEIDSPVIQYYPKLKKEPWQEFLEMLNQDDEASAGGLPEELVKWYSNYKTIKDRTGIQMRLPYDIEIR